MKQKFQSMDFKILLERHNNNSVTEKLTKLLKSHELFIILDSIP
uniref:Uncharacterized protein n=1 Tax=Arundo donax TaxID=35708 RepID=A0A0A8YX68_ARUDO